MDTFHAVNIMKVFKHWFLNSFLPSVPNLYPLKTPENFWFLNLWFSDIFRGYKMGTLARNGFASRCSKRIHANFWDFETYEKMLRRFIFVITGFGANWSSDRRDSIFFLPKKNVLKVINKNSFLMFNWESQQLRHQNEFRKVILVSP